MSSEKIGPGGLGLLAALALTAALAGCSDKGAAKPAEKGKPPVPVLVASVGRADVPIEVHGLGTVEASQSTPVRAQIGGTLTEVRFREGDPVTAGQILFQIDPRPHEAALRQLQAELARLEAQALNADAQVRSAEAQVRNAQAQASYADSQLKRYEELVLKDFVTRADYDQRRAGADGARAAVDASRANLEATRAAAQAARDASRGVQASLENAKLQLGYTTIRSPVSGQTGSLLAKQGDLVKASDTQLVVVNRVEPILVRFTVPEGVLADVQRYRRQGTLQVRVTPPGASAPQLGRLVFVDNAVDPTTATIALKAEFPNADRSLWPGQFLDVTLLLYTRKGAVVVPSQAVQTGQEGPYVFVVGAGGEAAVRPVVPGLAAGERVVVEKGVEPGETVIVDGQLKVTPGAKVTVRRGLGAAPANGKASPSGAGRAP